MQNAAVESELAPGVSLIKNKSVHDYSALIQLPADNNNPLHRPPLTFKTQINFVSCGVGGCQSGQQIYRT